MVQFFFLNSKNRYLVNTLPQSTGENPAAAIWRVILLPLSRYSKHGLNNVCLDLVCGYPGQSLESWIDTIRQTIAVGMESFQTFQVWVPPQSLSNGPIWKDYHDSPKNFHTVDETLSMKIATVLLAHDSGYGDSHYNTLFTKGAGGASQFSDKKYVQQYDMLGFGISAHNILGATTAIKEYASIPFYCSEINAGRIPFALGKAGTMDDLLRRSLLPLRNVRFLSKEAYRKRTGKDIHDVFGKKIATLKKYDLLSEDAECLRLTERGYYFSDTICVQFHNPEHMPFERNDYAKGELNPYNN